MIIDHNAMLHQAPHRRSIQDKNPSVSHRVSLTAVLSAPTQKMQSKIYGVRTTQEATDNKLQDGHRRKVGVPFL